MKNIISCIRRIWFMTMIGALFLPAVSAEESTFVDEYLYPEFNKTISLDFQDANLSSVLKILSQQSGMNFVASDAIKNKKISLYLDNVRVWEALERILESNSLTYDLRPGGNVFMVKELKTTGVELITRVYQLKFAPIPSHLINSTLVFDDSIGSSGGGTDSSSSSSTTTTTSEEDEGIVAAIKSVLSEEGSVVEDKRTNSLVVTDYPSQFALIEATIARLDVRIPQVLIEAEMLDISKQTQDRMGAKFNEDVFSFTGGSTKQVLWPFDNKDPNAAGSGNNTYPSLGTVSFAEFQFVVQFLRTQTDTKNLARPRILTLNNQTATIAIKTDEAIGLQQQSSGSGGSESLTLEAEREETGVFLKVTPYANVQTREITMAVEPKVIIARQGGTFGNQEFKDPEERGTKSILRVIDGDTIIIGGLLRTDDTNRNNRLPLISNIPIVGAAFRHKDTNEIQRELIVFLTPHIVEEHLAKESAGANNYYEREQDSPSGGARLSAVNDDLSTVERY